MSKVGAGGAGASERAMTTKGSLALALGLAVVLGAGLIGVGTVADRMSGRGALAAGDAEAGLLPPPAIGQDGLFVEPWFRTSTGDLAQDAANAAAEGKLLTLIWERDGCPYCFQLHTQDLRRPELHAYVADKFYVVRMNFFGEKAMRDFDGEAMTEREIALRHRAPGTPTMEFRSGDGKEVLRVPGYLEPPMLKVVFEFAETGAYKKMNINAWLKEKGFL